MSLSIVALYGALNGFLYLALTMNTSRLRSRHGIPVGDGGIAELQRAIRASVNYGAYLPLALTLLLVLELAGTSRLLLHAIGAGFLSARAIYALGALLEVEPAIGAGAFLTYLILIVEGINALLLRWR